MTREIDAQIAERIMGHTLAFSERAWTDEDWACSDAPTERNVMAIVADRLPGTGAFRVSIPHYSEVLNAAWTAADAFAERYGCAIAVERVAAAWEARSGARYEATIRDGTLAYATFGGVFRAAEVGPAEALCRDMLAALEVQPNGR